MEERKKCPDCAELVRAEARVCRFCGYRFEPERAGGSGGGVLADLLRRPRTPLSLPEILENWGLALDDGETTTFFAYCKLDRVYGFLLITSARVAFFAGRGGARLLDVPLAQLSEVEPAGGWGGRRLRLRGPAGVLMLRRFESSRTLAEAARLLGAS